MMGIRRLISRKECKGRKVGVTAGRPLQKTWPVDCRGNPPVVALCQFIINHADHEGHGGVRGFCVVSFLWPSATRYRQIMRPLAESLAAVRRDDDRVAPGAEGFAVG